MKERICFEEKRNSRKVTIVGVGQVGTACAYSIMQQVFKHTNYRVHSCVNHLSKS